MAWEKNLLDCSFRGFVFDVLKTDDSSDRALAEHAYPYLDGADVEDLGRNARRVTIDAMFYGDDYESRLQSFLKLLDQPGAGELVHPIFGSIENAQVVRSATHHEADAVDQAHVTVEFIESTPGNPFFDRALAAQQAAAVGTRGDLARGKLATALSNVIGKLRANSPLAFFGQLRQAMTLPIISMLSEVYDVVRSASDLVAEPRAFVTDISSIVDGVLNLKDFGASAMYDFGAVSRVIGLFEIFGFGSTGHSPAQPPVFTAGVPSESQAVAAVQASITVQAAIGEATAVGLVLASESETATLSPGEIETIADTARDALQGAIEAVRATYPLEEARPIIEALKDQALAVQEAAQAIIEARPPLIDRPAPVTGNLRLLAHAWYGDHARAPELFRLNPSLRLPNFVAQAEPLHAFAI